MHLQYSTPQTAVRLERAGFGPLHVSPTEAITTTQMRGTSYFRAQLFSRLIGNLGALRDTLTTPTLWSSFANEQVFPLLVSIFQAAQEHNIPYNGSYHIPSGTVNLTASLLKSGTGGFDTSPAQNLTSHAFEAIFGADNFLDIENHIVMEDVLDEMMHVSRTVTPTCE